jgi:HTH-type transcriptional regulator/antitoxin HigA
VKIKPIRSRKDHRAALREIDSLMGAEAGSPAGEKLDVLVTLVEAWERKHFHAQLGIPLESLIKPPRDLRAA